MSVRWGMLSTASTGRVAAETLVGSAFGSFVAVAGRDGVKAASFAASLGVPRSFGSYDAYMVGDMSTKWIAVPYSKRDGPACGHIGNA